MNANTSIPRVFSSLSASVVAFPAYLYDNVYRVSSENRTVRFVSSMNDNTFIPRIQFECYCRCTSGMKICIDCPVQIIL